MLYFQATLGHAHRARVRRLNAIPGIRCIGVEFADQERTRSTELRDGTPIETLATGTYEDIPWPKRAWSALGYARRTRPSAAIIDCPADVAQWAVGRGLQRMGVSTLVRWASTREDYPRVRWRELLKRFPYAGWDGYLATGARAAEYVESFGVDRSDIFVCGNPVDEEIFDLLGSPRIRERDESFLFVGRWIWHKNLPRLLDAFERYRSRGGRFALELAGSGDGADAEQLRDRIARVPGVRALGFLSARELASAYARASCLVLPSVSENWGLVVNEAMLAGLPVIVSNRCGCIPELVANGENGVVVDPFDVEDLTRAMFRIEALGADGRGEMAARSASRVAEQSSERWAQRVAHALRRVCTPRNAQQGSSRPE